MAKTTLATIKSFIRKNAGKLLINQTSNFDGMQDMVVSTESNGFSLAQASDRVFDNNMGLHGVWFVFGGRDYYTPYADKGLVGYEVSNCCGSFIIAAPSA